MLKDEAESCVTPATHIITEPEPRMPSHPMQWFGCEVHTAEARVLGCSVELFADWYDRMILGGSRGFKEWMNENG